MPPCALCLPFCECAALELRRLYSKKILCYLLRRSAKSRAIAPTSAAAAAGSGTVYVSYTVPEPAAAAGSGTV